MLGGVRERRLDERVQRRVIRRHPTFLHVVMLPHGDFSGEVFWRRDRNNANDAQAQ